MKKLIAIMSLMLTSAIFADQANTLISFSTTGTDRYADGTAVVDGEWYVLVWTPNAEFGGFTADFEPAVEGDEIVLAAPLAKNGRCPYTVFQVKSENAKTTGKYNVYLLDTRNNGKPSRAVNKKPAMVNGMVIASAAMNGGAIANDTESTVASEWAESNTAAMVAGERLSNPVITGIRPLGEKVMITVAGMHPSIRYNVKCGATLDSIETLAVPPMTGEADGSDVTFVLNKADGKFFRVVRQPLGK